MKATTELMNRCIEVCMDCFEDCNHSAIKCNDKPELVRCMELCNHCADACFQMAKDCESGVSLMRFSVFTCIQSCQACAEECSNLDTIWSRECAESCIKCMAQCVEIAKCYLN